MGQVLLLLVVALTVAAVVFGVTVLVTGRDPGLAPVEPDGRAVPLPASRPLRESDVGDVRFDTALRGYRMAQVDQALRRAAYDIGYKSELIGVLEAEVTALREGRTADADALRHTREQAAVVAEAADAGPVDHPGTDSGKAASADEPATGYADVEPATVSTDVAEPATVPARAADAAAAPEAAPPGTGEPADPAGGRGPAVRSEPA
ncbi:DivIVA domain-containing protein [Micromonospora sp. NBC_01655]|uniref:DivIVA domain-containing protein n=1 Tax=Micromonospora sp. NBC_01655 TaxID=2975983 RepID=UPI002255333C|nr:DivIVA domain-containing protein [Micromonospora sp. NBC_01655]MCX4474547.1 DivIVA domain-containing protein [Micromonospora sp. NBC_01655]